MKRSSYFGLVGAGAMAAGLIGTSANMAQEPAPYAQYPRTVEAAPTFKFKTNVIRGQRRGTQEIAAAAAAFRDAANDEAKATARKKLLDLLAKYFDEDMKAREAELKKVEDRVKKLRAQLDKRSSKKQEIIDLQVKVLENEADGLGFFNNDPGGNPWFSAPAAPGRPGYFNIPTPSHGAVIVPAEPGEPAVEAEPADAPSATRQPGELPMRADNLFEPARPVEVRPTAAPPATSAEPAIEPPPPPQTPPVKR
jgi:hypothetical protein